MGRCGGQTTSVQVDFSNCCFILSLAPKIIFCFLANKSLSESTGLLASILYFFKRLTELKSICGGFGVEDWELEVEVEVEVDVGVRVVEPLFCGGVVLLEFGGNGNPPFSM